MAICGNCGAATVRIRSIMRADGWRDECPGCAPQSFEKQTDPSDKKIWIGPEYAPNDYERVNGELRMKPHAVAELEESAAGRKSVAYTEEQKAVERAKEEKRASRRTTPLDSIEQILALKRIDEILRPMIEDETTAYEV